MIIRPLYIFDLDGTLALIHHRRHFVENGAKQWDEFHAACVDDKPNWPVINTYLMLVKTADIYIWSGRSDAVRGETIQWIVNNLGDLWHNNLKMRKAGDHQPDVTLKMGWLEGLSSIDSGRLVAAFDDRDRIVQAYRDRGVACFQVAPGAF